MPLLKAMATKRTFGDLLLCPLHADGVATLLMTPVKELAFESVAVQRGHLEYIGRYAYRVAISNPRILGYDAGEGKVTYDYKDYKHAGSHKTMGMSAVDFLHLFSLHILPPAFVRIRHYGLLSPSCRDRLRKVQQQLGGAPLPKANPHRFIPASRTTSSSYGLEATRRPL